MKKPTIFICAAEPSGDMLGSRLMQAIKEINPEANIVGVGGESMQARGLKTWFNIKNLAVMGLFEVLSKAFDALKKINFTCEQIVKIQPDVIVTIDAPSFNFRVAKRLKKMGVKIPIIHYVAPQVWVWKKSRAKIVHKFLDEILALLPFEPKLFEKYDMKTTFVGHSVIEAQAKPLSIAKIESMLKPEEELFLLLPGSRRNEVSRLLPEFIASAKILRARNPHLVFMIPSVETVKELVEEILAKENFKAQVVLGQEMRYAAFAKAKGAIAASGTVSLELGKFGVPHVVAYKFAPLTYWLAKFFIGQNVLMNILNILMKKRFIPEFLQNEVQAANLVNAWEKIDAKEFGKTCKQALAKLQSGDELPSVNAARRVLSYIK
jgi:lipid-A-disaccharide synthase